MLVLEYKMLYTSFQRNQSVGSGENDFKCFTIFGYGGHVVMWPGPFEYISFPKTPEALCLIWLQ